ncbi:helix-loop-helix DNA-binding domain-containing protein [Xylariaceae sp. FL1272]|nr:helix-loop-helix DNA-binding domain-containing protein [Xylariaceae sp. FL1272]
MDAGVMQDIDVYPSAGVDGAGNIFDNSADFTQQFASTNFWDTFEDSSTSSFVNSAAASVSVQSPSTSANSPASTTSAELESKPTRHSHKHYISGKSKPKKRRCSEESKQSSQFIQDPSTLDCSDYWLRFDSDSENFDQYFDYSQQDTKNVGPLGFAVSSSGRMGDDALSLNVAELSADAQVRSPTLSRPLQRASQVGTAGTAIKVAHPAATSDLIDDSALDQALSDEDDLYSLSLGDELAKTNNSQATPAQAEERLYSTPLSWEQPHPGFSMDYVNMETVMTDAERQRLLAIAMGTGQPQRHARPPSVSEFRFEMTHSPSETTRTTPEPKARGVATRPAGPSRRNSAETVEKKDKPKNNDRAAHNDIERKYRTNLKDKISELRDAVPSLRSIPEDEDGNSPNSSSKTAPKVSKGTVLTKATEYIHQLERRNRSMVQKNDELARRLQAFEQLVGAPPGPNWRPQGYGGPVYNQRF